jgi:RNA polymerase sigma factor (sigma-70 family)
MLEDAELLRRYADEKSEAAFAELVQRHLGLVYAVARRQVAGDSHLAEDVAQQVFTALARKASALASRPALSGWLYRSAHFAASDVVRVERRRRAREQEVHAMSSILSDSTAPADWEKFRPVLDSAIAELDERDRDAVALRFFENRPFAKVGARLRLTENAARMRVERALDKLHAVLARRGITSTTAALGVALANQAAATVPVGVAASVTGAALAGAAAGGSTLAWGTFMSLTKIQIGVIGGLLLVGAIGVGLQQQAHAELRDELSLVRRESGEAARLRGENARLAQAAGESNRDEHAELLQLRSEADALRRRLVAAAGTTKPPLAPGMVPAAAWQNRGRATPGAALETLLWAKEGVDFATMGKMMQFDPRARAAAEEVFASAPADVRAKLEFTTPEEMVALVWSVAPRTSTAGAQVTRVTPNGTDDVDVQLNAQRSDGSVQLGQHLKLHRTGDGWQWVVTGGDLENAKRGWGEMMRGERK